MRDAATQHKEDLCHRHCQMCYPAPITELKAESSDKLLFPEDAPIRIATLPVLQRLSEHPSLLQKIVLQPRARETIAVEVGGLKSWLQAKERAARDARPVSRCAGCRPSSLTFEFKKHRQCQCKPRAPKFGVKDFDLLSLVDWIDFECRHAARLQEIADLVQQVQQGKQTQQTQGTRWQGQPQAVGSKGSVTGLVTAYRAMHQSRPASSIGDGLTACAAIGCVQGCGTCLTRYPPT